MTFRTFGYCNNLFYDMFFSRILLELLGPHVTDFMKRTLKVCTRASGFWDWFWCVYISEGVVTEFAITVVNK